MSTEQHFRLLDGDPQLDAHRRAAVRHVCVACGVRTNAVGSAIYLWDGRGAVQLFEAGGFCGVEIAELQTVLAEGPAFTATRQNWPVLVPDLADTRHWPLFSPAAVSIGVAAVFAFPLTLNAHSLGAMELHRDSCGALLPDEITDAVHLAEVVTALLLDRSAHADDSETPDDRDAAAAVRSPAPPFSAVRTLSSVANAEAGNRVVCTNNE